MVVVLLVVCCCSVCRRCICTCTGIAVVCGPVLWFLVRLSVVRCGGVRGLCVCVVLCVVLCVRVVLCVCVFCVWLCVCGYDCGCVCGYVCVKCV